MINRSLNINLDVFGGEETDWIHLFQDDIPTDEINYQEAAEIIDAAFDVVPCFQGEKEIVDKEDPTVWDKIDAILKKVSGATFCEQNEDGGFDLVIKVAVSDIKKPYTLLINGGIEKNTQVVNEIVSGSKLVENSSQFTFDFPVLGNEIFNCPVPFVINGSTIYFQEPITTYFDYSYQTQYDLVTITTKPEYTEDNIPTVQGGVLDLRKYDNGQIGQLIEKPCTVTGLYSGKSRQLNLELPKIDESIENREQICLTEGGITATGGSRVCYEEIIHITNCECNDRLYPDNNIRTEKVVVSCPEEIKDCPAINPGCTSVISRTERHHYVECPDIFDTWDGDTPEYYEEKCCILPDVPLPKCKTKTTTYIGNKPIEQGKQYWLDRYSYADVTFHPVTPQGGICGRTITEQVIVPKDCCEDVGPLEVDAAESVSVLNPESNGLVVFRNGRGPFTFKAVSLGLWLDPYFTKREIVSGSRAVRVYSDEHFCGAGVVTGKGCGEATHTIASTVGYWEVGPANTCINPGGYTSAYVYGKNRALRYEDEVIRQNVTYVFWPISGENTVEQCSASYNNAIASGKLDCFSHGPIFGTIIQYCMVPISSSNFKWKCP